MLLGVVFLRERLRPLQWVPVGLAAAGVLYLTISYGSLPWISLVLAFTFGLYGLIKKLAPLGSLHGLTLETGMIFLPALGYLLAGRSDRHGRFRAHCTLLPDYPAGADRRGHGHPAAASSPPARGASR